jgi:hypothetical protein
MGPSRTEEQQAIHEKLGIRPVRLPLAQARTFVKAVGLITNRERSFLRHGTSWLAPRN